jgi:hypothetical protein
VRIIDYGTPCHSLAQCICCWQDCGQTSSPAFSSAVFVSGRPLKKTSEKPGWTAAKRRGGDPSIGCGGLKAPLSQPWSTTWGCSTRCWARVLGGRRCPPLRSREGWDHEMQSPAFLSLSRSRFSLSRSLALRVSLSLSLSLPLSLSFSRTDSLTHTLVLSLFFSLPHSLFCSVGL